MQSTRKSYIVKIALIMTLLTVFTFGGITQSTYAVEVGQLQPVSTDSGGDKSIQEMFGELANNSDYDVQHGPAYTLTGDHSYSDIYASFLFSNAKNETLDSLDASLEQLAKYPQYGNDAQTSGEVYGQMGSPNGDSTVQIAGSEGASYIKTLLDYDYLVPIPKDISKSRTPSEFFNAIIGHAENAVDISGLSLMLQTASFGAGIFDMFSGLIVWSKNFVTGFNPPEFLGLIPDENGNGGILSEVLKEVMDFIGITKVAPIILQIIFITMTLSFIIAVLGAIRSANKRKGMDKSKIYLLRILTIVCLLPTNYYAKGTIDKFEEMTTDNFQSPVNFNSHYVLDTMLFASTSNMSLGLVNPNGTIAGTSADGRVLVSKDFEPTNERIQSMMTYISESAEKNGIAGKRENVYQQGGNTVNDAGNNVEKSATSAKDLIGKVSSRARSDVTDYFSAISTQTSGSTIIASNYPVDGSPVNAGSAFNPKRYKTTMDASHIAFLSENPDKVDDKFSSYFQYKDGALKISESLKDSDGNAGDPDLPVLDPYNKKVLGDNGLNVQIVNIQGEAFPFASSSPLKYERVLWNKPSTYIYGATTSTNNTAQSKEYRNFINGPGTLQNNNPLTGKDDFKADEKDPKNEQKRIAMFSNALGIALMNKYAGIGYVPNSSIASLSTQSTAFLLQTEYTMAGTLKYSGYDTIGSAVSNGKNTGKYGNTFSTYTIPNKGKWDLISRIGAINMMWLTSGVLSALSFLYLLRSAIFGSLVKQVKYFWEAMSRGDFTAGISYLAHYTAMRMSFAFAFLGTYLGATFMTKVLNAVPSISSLFGVGQMTAILSPLISGWSIMLFTFLICVAFTYPIADVPVGGKMKRIGFLGAVILLPSHFADGVTARMERLSRRIYGYKQGSGKGIRMLTPKEHGQHIGKRAKQTGVAAARIGAAVATGGASAVVGTTTLGVAKSLGKKAMSSMAKGKILEDGELLPEKNNNVAKERPYNPIKTKELNKRNKMLDNGIERLQDKMADDETDKYQRNAHEDVTDANYTDVPNDEVIGGVTGQTDTTDTEITPDKKKRLGYDDIDGTDIRDEDNNVPPIIPIGTVGVDDEDRDIHIENVNADSVNVDEDGNPINTDETLEGADLPETDTDVLPEGTNNIDNVDVENADVGTEDVELNTPTVGNVDTDNVDTDNVDTGNVDTGNVDTGNVDTDNVDTGNVDTGDVDTDNVDTGDVDTDNVDTGNVDTDNVDTDNTELNTPVVDTVNTDDTDVQSDSTPLAQADVTDAEVKSDGITTDDIAKGVSTGIAGSTLANRFNQEADEEDMRHSNNLTEASVENAEITEVKDAPYEKREGNKPHDVMYNRHIGHANEFQAERLKLQNDKKPKVDEFIAQLEGMHAKAGTDVTGDVRYNEALQLRDKVDAQINGFADKEMASLRRAHRVEVIPNAVENIKHTPAGGVVQLGKMVVDDMFETKFADRDIANYQGSEKVTSTNARPDIQYVQSDNGGNTANLSSDELVQAIKRSNDELLDGMSRLELNSGGSQPSGRTTTTPPVNNAPSGNVVNHYVENITNTTTPNDVTSGQVTNVTNHIVNEGGTSQYVTNENMTNEHITNNTHTTTENVTNQTSNTTNTNNTTHNASTNVIGGSDLTGNVESGQSQFNDNTPTGNNINDIKDRILDRIQNMNDDIDEK